MIFKGRVALATLAMLVLTGYTDFTDEDITPSTEELYDSISIGFTQSQLELEYGEGLFNVRDFVSYADGELEVTTETVDVSQVGTNVILYGVTKTDEYGQTVTRYFPQGIRVVDTNYPVIELEKELIRAMVKIREEEGLSQAQLAEKCHVKQPVIARMEKAVHSPQIDSLLKILTPLGYKLQIVPMEKR